jgi:hypothetical protein
MPMPAQRETCRFLLLALELHKPKGQGLPSAEIHLEIQGAAQKTFAVFLYDPFLGQSFRF